jgi:hypothetical protein
MQSNNDSIIDRLEVEGSPQGQQPNDRANMVVTGDAPQRQLMLFYTLIEWMLWLAAIAGWCVVAYLYHLNP